MTSFFTVLVMWVNHHHMFNLIRRVSPRLHFSNGLLLLVTTTVPFTSALVSEYFRTPAARLACAVYSGAFFLGGIAYNLVWHSAARGKKLLKSGASDKTVEAITKNYRLGPPLYGLAVVVAAFSATLSMGICSALWIFWAVTARER